MKRQSIALLGYLKHCYFCAGTWGRCTCEFPDFDDERRPVLYWKEYAIAAPNVSECTRFFVDPVTYYGDAFFQYMARCGHICLVNTKAS